MTPAATMRRPTPADVVDAVIVQENGSHEAVAARIAGAARQPLDETEAFMRRFIAYPSEYAAAAHALWVAHTHLMEAWDSTPRIAFLSPERGSGKSRALEITELLVPRPVQSVNVSPAYLFRKVGAEEGRPTLLYDEIDTVFGPKAKDSNEEIRGLLNAGHRRHATAGRCIVVGKTVKTEELPAYCAVALAGLGDLPDTILTRSVVVRMRRRGPGEVVEPYRQREHRAEAAPVCEALTRWAERIFDCAAEARPQMPEGVVDRDADIWEPLLAVADIAGGKWPARARAAAVALVSQSKNTTPSLGVRLLADLRHIFRDAEHMSTEHILGRLCALDEAPWGDLKGRPLDARGLAYRLKPYGIRPTTNREGDRTPKGYLRADLWDAWQRYLGPTGKESATSATCETSVTAAAGVPLVADVADSMAEAPTGGADAEEAF